MNKQIMTTKATALVLASAILLASCSSKTLIQSNAVGAKVYLDDEAVGVTPYTHEDTKITGSVTKVKLEKEGYEPLITSFSRNEKVDGGAIVGGLFLLFPFLWTMKYKPVHSYEMISLSVKQQGEVKTSLNQDNKKSKAEQLRELKNLAEEKLISAEEYESQKKKILASND